MMWDLWNVASLAALFSVTCAAAAPLCLAGIGGFISERSGVINIGLEGMMLVGAFVAAWVGLRVGGVTGAWLGIVAAIFAGVLFGGLHALLCLRGGADQIISGVALNILASELTVFLALWLFQSKGTTALLPYTFPSWGVGSLQISPFFIFTLIALAGLAVFLYRSVWGLRLRACGEHPAALESAGISALSLREWAVLASGAFAGLAGAALVHGAGNFSKNMTAGRGYIALAALVFGAWMPMRMAMACLLFGFAYALNFQLQAISMNKIPSEFLSMLPYLLTLFALMGWVGRSQPPAALGKPLER
jgi:simple sugar transport system permease protein